MKIYRVLTAVCDAKCGPQLILIYYKYDFQLLSILFYEIICQLATLHLIGWEWFIIILNDYYETSIHILLECNIYLENILNCKINMDFSNGCHSDEMFKRETSIYALKSIMEITCFTTWNFISNMQSENLFWFPTRKFLEISYISNM